MNNYLIPANSKKSQLILGRFTPIDLAIFGGGALITFVLLMIFSNPSLTETVIILLPLLTTSFLVFPVPYYHNVLQLLTNIILYFTNRRHYYWKGWSVSDEKRF